jgi:hypothetical protein
MKRQTRLQVVAVASLALVVLGCTKGGPSSPAPSAPAPTTVGSPTPSASTSVATTATATPKPSPTVDPAIILAADGIGPYHIGEKLTDLTSKSLLVGLTDSMTCPGVKVANATGIYAGKLRIAFQSGVMRSIYSSSTKYRTPSGGKVGMKLTTLQSIYGSHGSIVHSIGGGGYLVRVTGSTKGVVFILDPDLTTAISIGVGDANALEEDAKSGEGC